MPKHSRITLIGNNHTNTRLRNATDEPKILDNEIKNVGAHHANPVKKLGKIPISPLY